MVAEAQTTSPGYNTTGPLSGESQTSSPVGQTDFQTDPFTGRFGYSIPLNLAPARHGTTPNLELVYNSANPNSWCGVGWDLDLGYIERETKYGVPIVWSGGHPASPMEYDDSKGFFFSFKNKMSDLVEISSGVYRAQIQGDFWQFQLSGDEWIVTDKSGTQYYFGESSGSRMTNPKSGWSASGDANTFHWALDKIVTATGDEATISYTSSGGRLYPQTYSYNGSTAGSGLSPLSVVQFNLTATNRPDATISCRSAYAVTNQYLLNSIVHTVNGQMVWSNRLNYAFSASTGRALLSSVIRYGADQSSALPPLTFNYSQQSFTFKPASQWGNLYSPNSSYNSSYYSFNNPLCDLVDIDGDGLPDRVIAPVTAPSTTWWVQHNNGSNGFGSYTTWNVGSQTYNSGYSTSTDPTWAQFNTHGRVIDMNGDGLPDLIVDPVSMFYGGTYSSQVVQLNGGANLLGQMSWTNLNTNSPNRNGYTAQYEAVENLELDDNYQVEMLDMNGDGLPDRVMDEPSQPWNNYFVQFNTGWGYSGTNLFGPFSAQGETNLEDFGGLLGDAGTGGNAISIRMFDINGDGLPDRVMLLANSYGPYSGPNQTNLAVELNNGYGFEPVTYWQGVNPYIVTCGGSDTTGIEDLGDDAQVSYRDVNGDGLPDRVFALQCAATPYTNFWVQLNTGTGFGPVLNWGPTASQGRTSDPDYSGIQSTDGGSGITMLMDMNGDGLPDRVEYTYGGSSSYYTVELSSGPYPDLLTVASNGIGGTVTVAYKPSTQYDNRQSTNGSPSQYLLPFVFYTVSAVSVGDGIYPSNTTTYTYTGGDWNYTLRQFDGFAQTTVTDPLGMKTVHWFHQAGGRNNSAYGEYADSTNTIGKVGMEYRTDIYGSDGNPYKTILNQVNEYSNQLQHFAYIATNIEIDYPATSTAYKARAKVYYYNLSNGNLTNETDWGQVTLAIPPSSESFTGNPNNIRSLVTQFASLANANIVDKPGTITLYDSTGNNVFRQQNNAYDGDGDLLQRRDMICNYGTPEYRTNAYTYDSYNNEQTHTDPAGIETTYSYDSTSQTFPTQATTESSYIAYTTFDPRSGELFSSTDWAGLVVSNQYDAFFRLTQKLCSSTPNGSPTEWLDKYTYTLGISGGPNNSVLHQQSDGVDSSNGHQIISWYDGLERTIQVRRESETSGSYRVVDTVYDQRGNIEFISFPYNSGSGTSRTTPANGLGALIGYDPIGRTNQMTSSVNASYSSGVLTGASSTGGDSGSPVAASTVNYYYNNDPWTLVFTDEAGTAHRYVMDAFGRTNQVVEVTSGGNYTMNFGWNVADDLLSVTDNVANVIQYSNNLAGEVIAMADPDLGVWQWVRDFAGRVIEQIDGDKQIIRYNYADPLGRLASRQIYDLKGDFYYGVTNIYDANTGDTAFPVYKGQLYETIDSEGFRENGFDVRGRKTITRRYVVKNGNTYTNQYSYDDMDRLRSIVYPRGGPTVTNIYDTGANLAQVQQFSGGTTYYHVTSFTPLDQIADITYGNGVTASYAYYSNSKRLQTAQTSGGLQNLGYTYDAVADVLSISDSEYSGGASAAISSVTYDSLHRLLSLTRNGQAYYYGADSTGNLGTNTENGSGGYIYSTPSGIHLPHAVKNANGIVCAYDTCGNMLARGGASLVYNPENRLIGMSVSNVGTTFGYEADGTRLWKQGALTNTLQVWIDNNYEEKDGKMLYHVWAGDRLVYTTSSDGSVAEYYHPDHLHSAEILSTSSGGLYQHYEFAAYGFGRYTSSTTAFSTTRRYTSQAFDEETGLYFYGSRYYDPAIGRFVQPDTVIPDRFDPQAYDRYAYARDNPLKYVDPNGHWEWPSWSYNWIPQSWVSFFGSAVSSPPPAQSAGSSQTWMALQREELGGYDASGLHEAADVAKAAVSLTPVGTFNSAYTTATGNNAYNPGRKVSNGDRLEAAGSTAAAIFPFISEAGAATGTVWDAIKATQPLYEGTLIPRSFELATENGNVWVHGNATEHLFEYAHGLFEKGVSQDAVNMATQAQLKSLQSAVSSVTAQGLNYGKNYEIGGWQLQFAAPREAGQLPALIHAQPLPSQ